MQYSTVLLKGLIVFESFNSREKRRSRILGISTYGVTHRQEDQFYFAPEPTYRYSSSPSVIYFLRTLLQNFNDVPSSSYAADLNKLLQSGIHPSCSQIQRFSLRQRPPQNGYTNLTEDEARSSDA